MWFINKQFFDEKIIIKMIKKIHRIYSELRLENERGKIQSIEKHVLFKSFYFEIFASYFPRTICKEIPRK